MINRCVVVAIGVGLAACGGAPVDGQPAALPAAELAPPAGPILNTLTLKVAPTVTQGLPARVVVQGAVGGEVVKLYGSRVGMGASSLCPAAHNFNCVNLRSPVFLGIAVAAADGSATMDGVVPPGATLGPLWLQAFAAKTATQDPARSRVVVTDVDQACRTETWWPGSDLDLDGDHELPHRVLVDVTAGLSPIPGAPVTVDVDLGAALAAAGVAGSVDPASVRVVRQDCSLRFPEMPAQFADRLVALDRKADHLSPAGDGRGTVAFLIDDDGDLSTSESLTPGETATFGIYFAAAGTGAAGPGWSTELVVVTNPPITVSTGPTTVSFDPARGGMLSALSYRGSGPLTDQASSCCGNSLHFWDKNTATGAPFGWVTPQSAPGDLALLESGPLLAAVRASGQRTGIVPSTGADYGTYTYDDLYWVFAGRPEVWHAVRHEAITDCTMEHEPDVSHGFRPIQLRHASQLYTNATYDNDAGLSWMAVTGARWGVAVGMPQPPDWFARFANPVGSEVGGPINYAYSAIHGNDFVDVGELPPFVVPAGTVFFDQPAFVLLPYAAPLADDLPVLDGLIEGVEIHPRASEFMP
ncbi:MAG TPA: hypothetical protein PKA64_10105 [Myxococcota bacterium]|nr:hypothetical protein [Myxococcota bacterium]